MQSECNYCFSKRNFISPKLPLEIFAHLIKFIKLMIPLGIQSEFPSGSRRALGISDGSTRFQLVSITIQGCSEGLKGFQERSRGASGGVLGCFRGFQVSFGAF